MLSCLPWRSLVQAPMPYARHMRHSKRGSRLDKLTLRCWPHERARKDQSLFLILCPAIASSCSASAKPNGPAESPEAGKMHRDWQLPCTAAAVLRLNPPKPSHVRCFHPCTYPSCFPGRRLEPDRQQL